MACDRRLQPASQFTKDLVGVCRANGAHLTFEFVTRITSIVVKMTSDPRPRIISVISDSIEQTTDTISVRELICDNNTLPRKSRTDSPVE